MIAVDSTPPDFLCDRQDMQYNQEKYKSEIIIIIGLFIYTVYKYEIS
jgi:hypothetical protein